MSKLRLIEAARIGQLAAAEELLQSGSDVNEHDEQGWTAIKFAAGRGDLAMVKLLAQGGANISPSGRDQRSPYMVALAAGHLEVAKFLREAGGKTETHEEVQRSYCRAYYRGELRRFHGWRENVIEEKNDNGKGQGLQPLRDDSIVYLHQNYSVTRSVWQGEHVVFNDINQSWLEFCHSILNFKVPDDFDLICSKSVPADNHLVENITM